MDSISLMDGPLGGGGSDTLQPGTMLGRYEVRRLIGQGGMGCVYEGIHRDLKKRVAIKTLLPALASNSDARQRFLREGESASRIRHPHVVDVTDVGSEGSVIYLVMEYLEGEDLSRLIGRQGALSATQAADIMLPVAAAIATAHEQSVIHRDLKPENIFLARTGYGSVHPKVLDFGISKVLGDSRARALTGSAATMGTMHYLPPEQLRAAREADARGDQYGLGTILYECVTGQRAFDDDSFYLILKKIAEGDYPPPSSRRPGLPAGLEAIIMRAMSLEPLDRFDSVREFGAALLEFASDSNRVVWTPFFGAAPVVGSVPRAVPHGLADQPRVATLLEPSAPAGATRPLPLPLPRRSASTTMRNATGERALPITSPVSRRSPALLVAVGVTLVAGVAALIALQGNGARNGRAETDGTGVEATPARSSATTPVQSLPPTRPIGAYGSRIETHVPAATAPTPPAERAPGGAIKAVTATERDETPPTKAAKRGAKGVNKIARRGAASTARPKKSGAEMTPEAAEPSGSAHRQPNDAPIIPD